jgi:predicted RNase H-like nuclease (RuvC/YqgF family)
LPQTDLESDPVLDQQISQLRTKISRVEIENRDLKDKIEVTNDGISSYISEMSTMLDSQELG